MKYRLILVMLLATLGSCSNGQSSKSSLSATEFSEKINANTNAVIIDVRTPGEFNGGHIANAINIDWNNNSAEQTLKQLDPSKAYYVYCLSGGRSSGAAEYMRANGFNNIFELKGGIMKWRAAGMAETTNNEVNKSADAGITMEAYQALLKNDKTVVIDIFAEWCGPCKKMAPYLNEMQNTMSDKVVIIRIDADKNVALCKQLNVDALPTVYVYKNNQKTFEHIGFLSKEELTKEL